MQRMPISRLCCQYPGCPKICRSQHGLTKHVRTKHGRPNWIQRVASRLDSDSGSDPGDPASGPTNSDPSQAEDDDITYNPTQALSPSMFALEPSLIEDEGMDSTGNPLRARKLVHCHLNGTL